MCYLCKGARDEAACSAYDYGDDLDLDSFLMLCLFMACMSGSYMLCILLMVSNVLLSVEYLHSLSCRHLLPLYVVYSTSCPCEFLLYHIDMMMFGLWCFGLLCLGNSSVEIMVGCCVFILSSCSPSWAASRACIVWSACGAIISICVWVFKSLMVLFPRSILTISNLPPLCFSSSWS